MGHAITSILLKGRYDQKKADEYDLRAVPLGFEITLFHIDHYYSAYWQYQLKTRGFLELSHIDSPIFPNEVVLAELMTKISLSSVPVFSIIQTDYFGGTGTQYANIFWGSKNADLTIKSINEALKHLGVVAVKPYDEFETLGLKQIHTQPSYLEKYIALANKHEL